MYPDLNDEDNKNQLGGASQVTYQSTTTTTAQDKKKKKEQEKDNCCVAGAKFWISVIGALNLLLGLFVAGCSLYAKFGYNDYAELSKALPDGGIWMIFGFGIVLALCSIVLLLAKCHFDKPCFKMVLVVFAIILSVLLVMEIVSGIVMVWGLGIIALPKSSVSDTAANSLLIARNKAVNGTYYECCVDNTPPYNFGNVTSAIDSACLWPDKAEVVKQACGDQNVLECVCKDSAAYGGYFGLFLRSRLLWVGVVTILFAVLLLFALIATCVLIWAKKKKSSAMYHSQQ
jgi:hypothetical protein